MSADCGHAAQAHHQVRTNVLESVTAVAEARSAVPGSSDLGKHC
jgi:hypothetical protein